MEVDDHLHLAGVPEGAALNGSLQEWSVLQPLWDIALANSYYTASPLFTFFMANSFVFLYMIPYMVLDFYGVYHWSWVKRYKIYPEVRVTWTQVRHCVSLTMWNRMLFVLPISIAQWVWTPPTVFSRRAPPLFEFLWQMCASMVLLDMLIYISHVLFHRIKFLYRHVHSVHHRFVYTSSWVSIYVHPVEQLVFGILATISPILVGTQPLTTWIFMMVIDFLATDSHGGYDLPLLLHRWVPFWGGSIHHAAHHERPLTNFEPILTWLDCVFGTNCPGLLAGGYRSPDMIDWEKKNAKRHDKMQAETEEHIQHLD
jgi:sterol desaturase/sphingolipid hydroxylase (fatty acid hydroxylase superfamily)